MSTALGYFATCGYWDAVGTVFEKNLSKQTNHHIFLLYVKSLIEVLFIKMSKNKLSHK